MASTSRPSPARPLEGYEPYEAEARLYAPPLGTFDPDWATRILRQRRPDLHWDHAARLVMLAWRHLWRSPQLSRDELVDYCLSELSTTGPGAWPAALTHIHAAVDAVVDFCEAFAVEAPRSELD